MAKKSSTVFVCNNCGYDSTKWLGKCPACNEWNSFVEEKVIVSSSSSSKDKNKPKNEVIKLNEVEKRQTFRIKTDVGELDRVLGGGFVTGSLTLLGGEPGIGKSTLILQICNNVKVDGKILYVSGEESAEQIKSRAGGKKPLFHFANLQKNKKNAKKSSRKAVPRKQRDGWRIFYILD